jgi:hypothetical protein
VDFQRLKYRSNFEAHLKKKLPSLDRLLIKFDQISSAIFSFAFLIICMLLSLAAWFVITVMIIIFTNEVRVEEEGFIYDAFNVFLTIVIILHLLASLLYVIDTLWIGVIKRIKWISKLYHPFYRYMNFITFSFLYRSIYYHLISYIGIWRSRFLIHLIIVPLISLPFIRFDQQIFYPDGNPENEIYTSYYDDMRTEDDYINTAAIASSIIKENSLPLFLHYAPDFNTALLKTCAYQPSKKAGFSHGLEISNGGFYLNPPDVEEANSDSLLHCLTDFFRVYINDSLYADQTYVYLTHPNKGERGIYTVLDISAIPVGYSAVRIDGQKWFQNVDSLATYTIATIPFWKE